MNSERIKNNFISSFRSGVQLPSNSREKNTKVATVIPLNPPSKGGFGAGIKLIDPDLNQLTNSSLNTLCWDQKTKYNVTNMRSKLTQSVLSGTAAERRYRDSNYWGNRAQKTKQSLGSPFVGGVRGMTLLLMLILATFTQVWAQDTTGAHHLRLEEHLQTAAENNPGLKASFNHYLASLEQIPQVGALPDPELAFGYFISPIETRVGPQTARFSLSQLFPWFGTLDAREDIKINEAKARFEEFQAQRNRLFYKVKSTWYELYVMNERIAILEENIEILESLEELALQKVETAQGSQPDVLRVQIELEDLRITRSNLLDDRRVLRQEFSELLNSEQVDFPETMALSPLALPSGEQELRQQMLEQNPGLNQLSFREQATEHAVRAARLEGLPKFGVGFDYILTNQRDITMTNSGKDAFMARASIQIPLFRKKYRAQKRQAELNQRSVTEQQVAKQNELVTALEKALRDYRNTNRQLNLYEEKQIKRTRQAIDILTEEYASADTEFEEILRLQRRLLDYQRLREEALGSQNNAVAQIELLTGHYNIEPEERNK